MVYLLEIIGVFLASFMLVLLAAAAVCLILYYPITLYILLLDWIEINYGTGWAGLVGTSIVLGFFGAVALTGVYVTGGVR